MQELPAVDETRGNERLDTEMMNSHFGTRPATVLAWAMAWALTFGRKLLVAVFPQAEISNGQLRVKLHLSDTKNRCYRGSRFDWSSTTFSRRPKLLHARSTF
jgi:hypothetical protein